MRSVRELEFDGVTVSVNQLTVKEIRGWFRDTATLVQSDNDLFENYLFEKHGVTVSDIIWLTNITREDVENLTQDDLRKLIDVIKEVNSDFFTPREAVLRKVMELQKMPSATSTEQSAQLSEQVIPTS